MVLRDTLAIRIEIHLQDKIIPVIAADKSAWVYDFFVAAPGLKVDPVMVKFSVYKFHNFWFFILAGHKL
jgi:hypothetical protein